MDYRYDPMVRYMTDDSDSDSLDSSSNNAPDVDYHFDGFDVEISAKVALTPIHVKPNLD
jgi:hypothetical protein